MVISNSFHSSAKDHSISSPAALGKAAVHNERDYVSARFSADRIHYIVGEEGLAESVKTFINDTLQPYVDEYDAKQKRKDRRYGTDPFTIFGNQKTTDLAAEAIFQIADMGFWERWRTDEVIYRDGKETVKSSYSEGIMEVMDEIFKAQMKAYEEIYTTHKNEILGKIRSHYQKCQDVLQEFKNDESDPERYNRFVKLAEIEKPKERKAKLKGLSDEEKELYYKFQEAYHSAKGIEKKQLIERTENDQMHIKMIQGVGHYDEKSPHAHGVSVCWTEGYKRGLKARLAKSIVLNRFALEVIQERLHEIAQEEISKHPEIFGNEKIKEKSAGRTINWTTEQYIRMQNERLVEENAQLKREKNALQGEIDVKEQQIEDMKGQLNEAVKMYQDVVAEKEKAEKENSELRSENLDLQEKIKEAQREADLLEETNKANLQIIEQNEKLIQDQEEALSLIQTYEEYEFEADAVEKDLDLLENATKELPAATRLFKTAEANAWLNRMNQILKDIRKVIEAGITRLQIFERVYDVAKKLSEPLVKRFKDLDEQIGSVEAIKTPLERTESPQEPSRDRNRPNIPDTH